MSIEVWWPGDGVRNWISNQSSEPSRRQQQL